MANAGKGHSIVRNDGKYDPFLQLDKSFNSFLDRLVFTMRSYVESNHHPDPSCDDEKAKRHFSMLVRHAVEHAITPQLAAAKLGVTVSTIHRWAKGEFVPSQRYIRVAAISGIASEISELLSLDVTDDGVTNGEDEISIDDFRPRSKN